MARELVKGIRFNVETGATEEYEEWMDMPNPRISEIERRLPEIRNELTATDYKVLKFTEGALTGEEFDEIKAERAKLRDEYNALEQELTVITNGEM